MSSQDDPKLMLVQLQQMLKDHIDHYDFDRVECRERYRADKEEARSWRDATLIRIEKIEHFMAELRPNYARALVFTGIVVLGSFGLIWKMIWDRVSRP